MKKAKITVFALSFIFIATAIGNGFVMAEERKLETVDNYYTLDPMAAELLDTGQLQAVSCTDSVIAFSAYGESHVSEGLLTLLWYTKTTINEGGIWTGATFVAPCDGVYFFTASFVKDAYYYSATTDDVYVYIMRNGQRIGQRAWSGQGTGARGTGTTSVIVRLSQNDLVQTFAHSDGPSVVRPTLLYI